MVTIYGTKTITEEDLFKHCGKPNNIKKIVYSDYKKMICKFRNALIISDIESTFQRAEFNIIFIPLELVEMYILYVNHIKSLDDTGNSLLTHSNVSSIFEQKRKVKEEFEARAEAFMENDTPRGSMFLALVLDGPFDRFDKMPNLKSYYVCIPRKIFAIANKPIKYTCKGCGKTFKYGIMDLPNMYYRVESDKVSYYCKKCNKKVDFRTVNVGDTFFGK